MIDTSFSMVSLYSTVHVLHVVKLGLIMERRHYMGHRSMTLGWTDCNVAHAMTSIWRAPSYMLVDSNGNILLYKTGMAYALVDV